MAACGADHSAAVDEDGSLWTWGRGSEGRLGHGDAKSRDRPTRVHAAAFDCKVFMVSLGGLHSAAVLDSGDLLTWGYGEDGALGVPKPYRPGFRDFNEKETLMSPTKVPKCAFGGAAAKMISCGLGYTACVNAAGALYMWGLGRYGVLGQDNERDHRFPQLVSPDGLAGTRVELVSCGHFHIAAVVEGGGTFSWGYGGFGALGLGHKNNQSLPARIVALKGCRVVLVAAGEAHTLAATADGQLYSWGQGERGRLGLGHEEEQLTPSLIAALHFSSEPVVSAAAGGGHSAAVVGAGKLFIWGKNQGLGRITEDASPACGEDTWRVRFSDALFPVCVGAESMGNELVRQVAAGTNHSMAVTASGRVWTWGLNSEARLGVGDDQNRNTPALLAFDPLHTRIGRFRRLTENFCIAFAMGTHDRLGCASPVLHLAALPELVQMLVESCHSWPPADAIKDINKNKGLIKLLGGA